MCVPLLAVAAASLLVSAASAGFSIAGQEQKQKAEASYQTRLMQNNEQQMQENRDLATKAYLDQASAANTQLSETREASAVANFDKARQGAEARGAALAAAGDAGVYGVSLDALLSDFHRQEAMFTQRNNQNLVMKEQATAQQISGFRNEAQARSKMLKPYQPGPLAPVDYVGPALAVVQSGANSYMNFNAGANRGAGIRDSSGVF